MKQRLDIELYERGLARSRTAGAELVYRGSVLINKERATKSNQQVSKTDTIEVTSSLPYVSRGGEKLAHALKKFHIQPAGFICLDIGSSTGGFTDCLLQNSAKKVYAVDVGTGQLAPSIRTDERVVVFEQTDIRDLELTEQVDLIVIDVSFISLTKILNHAIKLLKPKCYIIVLIKPQFELGRESLNRNGIVKDNVNREKALETIKKHASDIGLKTEGQTQSPIQGGDGNIEFLLYLKLEK